MEYLRQPGTKANWKDVKKWLLKELPEWADSVPYQIKGIAVKEACAAVKKAKEDYGRTGKINKVKFRSRKNVQQSVFIPKSAVRPTGFYQRTLGQMRFAEKFEGADHDSRVVYRQGRWFLSVPVKTAPCESENQGRMVALDPGIRTFQTYYSADTCGKIGRDFARIQRLCHHLDSLLSRMMKVKARKRYRMKKAADRLRWKIRDLIQELHHKAALFFVKNFDLILIPSFKTSQMVLRGARKIRAKSVRSMLSFAHYKFRQHLEFKAWEHGKRVVVVNEAYTSKTCSWNGVVKPNVGGRKTIEEDGVVVDRDYNGARGIYIRALVDSPTLALCKGAFVNEC